MLLLEHWLGASPAVLTPVLDPSCYLLAFRYLGWRFIRTSVFPPSASRCFTRCGSCSAHAARPFGLAAAGVGAGRRLRGPGRGADRAAGGSSGGDDALALTIARVTRWRLSRTYLFTDLVVLGLSLTYLPAGRIVFSLITVTLSSWIIDRVQGGRPCRAG